VIPTPRLLAHGAAVLALALSASAQVLIQASKDNTLYSDQSGMVSNGKGQHFFVGRNAGMTAYPIRRGLIAFDVAAAIPAGSQITSVQLTLSLSQTISGPIPIQLHRALQDWGEGASDAPGTEGAGDAAEPGDATWVYRFFNTANWSTPGGSFISTASASLPVGQAGFYTWPSTPALVADVQGWLDAPSTNFGWFVRGAESTSDSAKRFDSRENPFPSLRPVLSVTYSAGASVYCLQAKPTSVPGCSAKLTVTNPTLASGAWSTADIARDVSAGTGSSLGIYIYTHGVGIGPSGVSLSVPYGTLCLSGFKRSAPACSPALLAGAQGGVCNVGPMTTAVNCSGGALGIAVGDDVNVQLWYRDPLGTAGGNANFSNAIFYTVQ
jgi:hypothetical protein